MLTPGFSYAQARLQARVSALPQAREWEHLNSAKTLSNYLEEARGLCLKPWVAGFSMASSCHDIERGIRRQLDSCIQELVVWTPRPWKEAVLWCRGLQKLPLLSHLSEERTAPSWMRVDPLIEGLLDGEGRLLPARLQGAELAPLVEAWRGGESLLAAWLPLWRSTWPPHSRRINEQLEAAAGLLMEHRRGFSRVALDEAWAERGRLRCRLGQMFHRCLLEPAALFVYLGLVACDLERLRGDLVSRALFQLRGGG